MARASQDHRYDNLFPTVPASNTRYFRGRLLPLPVVVPLPAPLETGTSHFGAQELEFFAKTTVLLLPEIIVVPTDRQSTRKPIPGPLNPINPSLPHISTHLLQHQTSSQRRIPSSKVVSRISPAPGLSDTSNVRSVARSQDSDRQAHQDLSSKDSEPEPCRAEDGDGECCTCGR